MLSPCYASPALVYNDIYMYNNCSTAVKSNNFFYTSYSTKSNTYNNKVSLKYISIVNDSLLKLSCVDKVY